MTLKDLIGRAKTLNISGRWDMSKEQLTQAIAVAESETSQDDLEAIDELEEQAFFAREIDPKVVAETKRRYPSLRPRDETGKVIRRERNLSGNRPYTQKFYFFNELATKQPMWEESYKNAPPQVRFIIAHMREEGIVEPEQAQIGGDIAGDAINSGRVTSTSKPAALFAYYRKVMETLGLELAE